LILGTNSFLAGYHLSEELVQLLDKGQLNQVLGTDFTRAPFPDNLYSKVINKILYFKFCEYMVDAMRLNAKILILITVSQLFFA
jgi:hypothetical protein